MSPWNDSAFSHRLSTLNEINNSASSITVCRLRCHMCTGIQCRQQAHASDETVCLFICL